ncbi:hypothetical protein DSL72_008061 [Monilinia vaccinii-corymbosi]|uniref:FAD-binding FR-type domain-containing protein n=1 Tax=Monilinia vaccinii-corymbosi TaxID=61207 RepID=A0A8A3PJN9_9HELO|nr:hypothetical protein DSL72_008061 [Monilinia vaccinii-corymbosi]
MHVSRFARVVKEETEAEITSFARIVFEVVVKEREEINVGWEMPAKGDKDDVEIRGVREPGQWVDLYLPGIEKPGGYSITNFPRPSAPGTTNNRSDPSILKSEKEKSSTRKGSMEIELEEEEEEPGIELAIQKPVFKSEEEGKVGEQVTWLFRNPEEIMGAELRVRIGGSFVWPPDSCTTSASSALSPQPTNANDENSWRREIDITRVIFIAGGMGINPLMSMIGYINSKLEMREENDGYARESEREREEEGEIRYENLEIQFLYTSKTPAPFNEGENEKEAEIPFLPRLTKIFGSPSPPNQPQPQPQPQPPNPKINWNLHLFLTNTNTNTKTKTPTPPFSTPSTPQIHTHPHRIHPQDIQNAIPQTSHARKKTLIYICGPPAMADEMIGYVNVRGTRNGTGTDCNGDEDAKQSFRIFCERWW